jgi:hypothetical protein
VKLKRISIKAGPGSKIRIVRKSEGEEKTVKAAKEVRGENTLLLSFHFLDLAEIRAESSFRPQHEDVEVLYALSGRAPNVPDTFHKLSSRFVIREASASMILTNTEELVKHILKECEESPNLIIVVHTHPEGIAHPSETDRDYFHQAAQLVRNYVPVASVIFGIHSVSSEGEMVREREEPKKTSKNRIAWSSITRSHELVLYSEHAKPVEVTLVG